MAVIERITLTDNENDCGTASPGLRISVRSTTSSLSDYPEWCLDGFGKSPYESVVSDGACS
jgi:hypothetical protein